MGKQLYALVSAILVSLASGNAQDISLEWSTNKHPLDYRVNEEMCFAIQLFTNTTPLLNTRLDWKRTGDDGVEEKGTFTTGTTSLIIRTHANAPGFVRIAVVPYDRQGKPMKYAGKDRIITFEGGAAAEPNRLLACAEPKDFDAFWEKQKALLKKVPLQVERILVQTQHKDFTVYDVKITCAGAKPVSGYLSIPRAAKHHSLPIQVGFKGYSVSGADIACINDQITLNINAHGIENGKPPSYYQALESGELKGYGFRATENSAPETAYFLGMFLRVMRAIDYVQTLPEWDGRNLAVAGGSQGGFQALAAAALRADVVTRCSAFKPWCCDLAGVTKNRISGWRPAYTPALDYFDGVAMARRIRCPTTMTCGLGDYVCPPSGLVLLYTTLSCNKKIEFFQGVTHEGATPPCPRKPLKYSWEKNQ